MRISGRNTPEDDRRPCLGNAATGCTKQRGTEKRIQHHKTANILLVSNSKLPAAVNRASLFLALIFLCRQTDWNLVLATRDMASAATTLPRRSLAFVAGRNGHRTCALVPCPSVQSSIEEPKPRHHHNRGGHISQTQSRLYTSRGSAIESVSSSNVTNSPQLWNEKLRSDLEDYRIEKSKVLGKRPSMILTEKLMDGISSLDPVPTTVEDLSKVKGMGAKRLDLYGKDILDLAASSIAPKASKSASHDSAVNTTLRASNPISTTTGSVIQTTATTITSRYSNQIGFNESFVQQQQRSHSNLTVTIHDSKTENEISTTDTIEEESSETLQQADPKMTLRSKLENYRIEKSKALGKAPSMILTEKLIDGICSLCPLPTTIEDLTKVKGLGAKRLGLYGEDILRLVSCDESRTDAEEIPSVSGFISTESTSGNTPKPSSNDFQVHAEQQDKIPSSSSSSSSSSLDSLVAPPPYSAPKVGNTGVFLHSDVAPAPYSTPEDDTAVPALDSYVAPAPYSDPGDDANVATLDSFVAPAPYSSPNGSSGIAALDSYVAPAPYSFDDEEEYEDDFEDDDIISEESFGASSSTLPSETKDDEKEMTTTKLRKTQLKKDLKEYRLVQKQDGKAAYTVFTNAALDGIYASLPVTMSELLQVKGIGPKKLELYGDDILEIVAPYAGLGGRNDPSQASGEDTSTPIQRKTIDPESLTREQRQAADMILETDEVGGFRRNVFVTGSAGTGKSHLLKYVVETLAARNNLVVGVCAPTGVAAVIVGGSTLHSFFGIGLGTGSPSTLLKKVRQNSAAKTRIDETDVLIIDECSMLSAELLETLDMVTRNVRRSGMFSDVPFGGMQVIAFGDFFQLPPVHKYDGNTDRNWRPFCFDSPVWSELGLSEHIIELQEVQRQEEGDFVHLLNKVRTGRVSSQDILDLNENCLVGPNHPLPNDGILPTRLYVLNRDVDSENAMRLEELSGKEVVCTAQDSWRQKMPLGTPAAIKKKMKESLSMQMPDQVKLKVGAQVMLTRNKDLEKNLVNGSRGVVEGFESNNGSLVPVVRFDSGITTRVDPVEFVRHNSDGGEGCLVRMQVPLKLAWAVTIHKSQGSTLTRASLDISSAFEYGQCYVALSRVRSLDGLWLERPAELGNVLVSPQVLEFFANK